MNECERMDRCRYFLEHLKELEAVQEMWKRKFCKGDKNQCARYMVLKELGVDQVPDYLVPTQVDKAKEILKAGR
ncbi:MAG: hypothetical protein OEY01_05435 [Desulfobulbaceae bacterium]|nr:hypothetical protein [Desulfobulbaceae bacterium]HIJ78551.1 hypothetical protein [Deltaproteobacteria bacterium]